MNATNRKVDLRCFFPFKSCSGELVERAYRLGRCVKYNTGESVLLSGSPAKHCGIIIEGQAVAFKFDGNQKRYQLFLDEGCFIGLESLQENNFYSGKIVALTDLDVFFWNLDGLTDLTNEFPEFMDSLNILNEGRIYQEQWLIPETDVTDPVLCSAPVHWLSIGPSVFGILLVLFIFLWACSLLIRRYPVAWLLVFGLTGGAGTLIYRFITERIDERLIVTTKNIILIPGKRGFDLTVYRLCNVQSLIIDRNMIEHLLNIGRINFLVEDKIQNTPLVSSPEQIASLMQFFAERASMGRPVVVRTDKEQKRRTIPEQNRKPYFSDNKVVNDKNAAIPKFKTVEFHAHWALLVKMLLKPAFVLVMVWVSSRLLKGGTYWEDVRKILLLVSMGSFAAMFYQFFSWRNHRFFIEEDRIRDYSRKPLTSEDQNVAMNNKIHSVRFTKKGFFQVLLNYGTVYILAGEGELSFDYVGNPQDVQKQIMDNCARFEAQQMMNSEARQREYINGLISGIKEETNESLVSGDFIN